MDYTEMSVSAPLLINVVETPEFISRAEKLMTDENREQVVAYLAANPTAGDLIPGTGGVRKLRYSRRTSGWTCRKRIGTAFVD